MKMNAVVLWASEDVVRIEYVPAFRRRGSRPTSEESQSSSLDEISHGSSEYYPAIYLIWKEVDLNSNHRSDISILVGEAFTSNHVGHQFAACITEARSHSPQTTDESLDTYAKVKEDNRTQSLTLSFCTPYVYSNSLNNKSCPL